METIFLPPLEKAVTLVGGQTALARKLGVKQQNIHWWLTKSKKVPAERCIAIERATNCAVSRYALRPDVFGPDPVLVLPPRNRAMTRSGTDQAD